MSSFLCTKLSYRASADTLNLFLHRNDSSTVKLRTLSDSMTQIGSEISCELTAITNGVLKENGFDASTGMVCENVILSKDITTPRLSGKSTNENQAVQEAIDEINQFGEEEIPFRAEELDIEKYPADCVYISIDDIGVKRQKDTRVPGSIRESRYVENTVAHIQHAGRSYVITAIGMRNVFKSVLAFLLMNNLLTNELVFFTDGARNIKNNLEEVFSFHPYIAILDWYHLKKKCQELLSMAMCGKEKRNAVLKELLSVLWIGNVDEALAYLKTLPPSAVRDQKRLDELASYLERKRKNITCYAVREKIELRNSSNPVEKANDILVAQRQKHNGMAWSPNGSGALAAIQMLYQNHEADLWFCQKQLRLSMSSESSDTLCA